VDGAETALILARAQFAFTISFHFIFPAFSIGLASYLFVLEGLWLWTGAEIFRAPYVVAPWAALTAFLVISTSPLSPGDRFGCAATSGLARWS